MCIVCKEGWGSYGGDYDSLCNRHYLEAEGTISFDDLAEELEELGYSYEDYADFGEYFENCKSVEENIELFKEWIKGGD